MDDPRLIDTVPLGGEIVPGSGISTDFLAE